MRMQRWAGLAVLTIAVGTFGCGGETGPKPANVTGQVLLDGKAMADGMIYFEAKDGRPPVSTKIVDGQYALKPTPGEYRVAIQQFRDTGAKNVYGDPQMESAIPARYNVESELKATVTAEGPNQFDFAVLSR